MNEIFNSPESGDWRLFVDSVEDAAMFMLDVAGRVMTWNGGARRIYEYAAPEIVGEHLSVFHPADEGGRVQPDHELALALERGRFEEQGWRVRKDGSRFWANAVVVALRDERGALRGFGKVVHDLSGRLPRDDDSHAEPRQRSLVDSVRDYAIFMLDADGHIATWNRGAQAIKGYQPHEIIGRHFSTFYPPEDLASGKPAWELAVAAREGSVEDEGWRVRKDGSRFWASVVITAVRDGRHELVGFTKVTRDLTARKMSEEALRRSEERFRLLIDSVVDYAMYMLDPSGYVTTWNHGAENLKGYRAADVVGRHFSIFFPEEDRQAGKPERELQIARERGRFEEEAYRCRQDGSRFLANVVLTPIRDTQGQLVGFAKVTRDLTVRAEAERTARELIREQAARAAAEQAEARIRAAAELAERAAKQAEEASRLKDEFLATVSHELRTPLNAIVGWSSLLQTRTSQPDLRRGLDVIHRNALAQGRIVEDILDVSRIITGKLRLDLAPVDLASVVRDAIDVIRPAASARNMTVELQAPEEPYRLIADAERLQQVIWNLLSNAVKFGKKGGKIQLAIGCVNSSCVLTVADDGQGIDPSFLPFVFDRFKQADGSATRRIGGLGLGLSLVRHLVELHGGWARVSSPGIGQGTCFTITLPVRALRSSDVPAYAEGTSVAQPPEPLPARALQDVRVLVVDDEEDARELVATVLTAAGASVVTAGSSAEGIAAFHQFRPHVLVSDVGMPEEDGYTFMRRVHALGPDAGAHVPALALTAYARAQDRMAALAAGFTNHLGKPVEPAELVRAVEELVRNGVPTRS